MIALTHSTTLGLAQIRGGVRISRGHEILTARTEHPATLETLQLRAERDGTPFRQVPLFRDSRRVTSSEITQALAAEIRPWTRVLTLTWVFSIDGVKLPIDAISNLSRAFEFHRRLGKDRLQRRFTTWRVT